MSPPDRMLAPVCPMPTEPSAGERAHPHAVSRAVEGEHEQAQGFAFAGAWIIILVGVMVIVGLLWIYRERSSQATTEAIQHQVEEELYRECELEHLPGQLPVRSAR